MLGDLFVLYYYVSSPSLIFKIRRLNIWPNPEIVCQDLGRLNLPVTVSTPEEFTENLLGNTAWLARLYFLVLFL